MKFRQLAERFFCRPTQAAVGQWNTVADFFVRIVCLRVNANEGTYHESGILTADSEPEWPDRTGADGKAAVTEQTITMGAKGLKPLNTRNKRKLWGKEL